MTAAMTRDARRLCERRQILRGRSRAPRLRDRGLDAWRHGLCARISCRAVFPRDPDRAYRADQRAADPVAHRRTRVGAAEIVLRRGLVRRVERSETRQTAVDQMAGSAALHPPYEFPG